MDRAPAPPTESRPRRAAALLNCAVGGQVALGLVKAGAAVYGAIGVLVAVLTQLAAARGAFGSRLSAGATSRGALSA
jgi:hypothetical protein